MSRVVNAFEPTKDAIFGGRVVIFQPPRGKGYRTNVDALLLADFASSARSVSVAFDLGAGVGAIGLSLLWLGAAHQVVFVELDPVTAALAKRNLEANGWGDRGEVIRADVREVAEPRRGAANLIVCNPPYVAPGRGRVPPAEALARSGEVEIFVRAARQIGGRHARFAFVFPASELTHLLATLANSGLYAKRLRFVHATGDVPARIVLVETVAGRPGGLSVLPALVERTESGYSPQMLEIFQREPSSRSSAMAPAARTLR